MDWRPHDTDGERAEVQVAADLIKEGCQISFPIEEYRYDIIADKEGELVRIQIKKASQMSGADHKYKIHNVGDYDSSEVDIFAGYIFEIDEAFYVAINQAGKNNFRINTKSKEEIEPENLSDANLLEDYTLEKALSDWRNAQDCCE